MIRDPELLDLPLRRHSLDGVVAEHGLGDVLLVPGSVADADGEVAVSFPRLVADHLDPVQLEDRTGRAHAAFGVEDGGHALLHGQGAGS